MITGLLLLLPAALLFCSLILGRYPGEEALECARTALRAPLPRPALVIVGLRRAVRAAAGPARLVAAPMAARAPPCG